MNQDQDLKERKRKSYLENKQFRLDQMKKYRESRKFDFKGYALKYKEEKKEELAAYRKRYKAENKGKINSNNAKRRAAKKHRTPSWLTQEHYEVMQVIFTFAQTKTKMTGELHHVDHIVPLIGKTVSGLHVPWNLQIIQASDNLKKNNLNWPDCW